MAINRPGKTKIKIQRTLGGNFTVQSKEGTKIDQLALELYKTRTRLKWTIGIACLFAVACGIMGVMLYKHF